MSTPHPERSSRRGHSKPRVRDSVPQAQPWKAKERKDPAETGPRKGRLCVYKEESFHVPCVCNRVDLLAILPENVSSLGIWCLRSKTPSVSPITQSLSMVFLPFGPILWPLLGLLSCSVLLLLTAPLLVSLSSWSPHCLLL